MRKLLLAAIIVVAAAPAGATEWIHCGNADGSVTLGLLAGSFDVLAISAVTLGIGGESWSSGASYGPGRPIIVAQAWQGSDQLIVDLADDNAEEIVAELRVHAAEEGRDRVQGGVLRAPDRGAWIVSCEGT